MSEVHSINSKTEKCSSFYQTCFAQTVIGGVGNTYSWLRNTSDTTIGLDSHLPNILSPLWPTPIIIEQKHDGRLDVSIPEVAEPLLTTDASDLTNVQSFCLYAWRNPCRWFFNCTEIEDDLLDDF
ncbi:uncharacterized protein LOC119649593 isoform X2 [Hermetia illucens]|uniref:uncharacterized protein LOC119649593 isoform X2 n=1 Tax=Hermetia illucens TaxID=343691 RepID=UPI0018CC4DD5|nr:uncharacterized protein LOC119649593 isoform X2 [Hermetia illucens]